MPVYGGALKRNLLDNVHRSDAPDHHVSKLTKVKELKCGNNTLLNETERF